MNNRLFLIRRDRARNMARFYRLDIDPDLFGGAAVTRNWGRIGTKGRFRIDLFRSTDEAQQWLATISAAKLRRGYRLLNSPR